MSRYRFEENIKKLSESQDIKEIPNEWVFIYRVSFETKEGHCICNNTIKHINYYFNESTFKAIQVGDGCKKKLSLHGKTDQGLKKFSHLLLHEPNFYIEIMNLDIYTATILNKIWPLIKNLIRECDLKEVLSWKTKITQSIGKIETIDGISHKKRDTLTKFYTKVRIFIEKRRRSLEEEERLERQREKEERERVIAAQLAEQRRLQQQRQRERELCEYRQREHVRQLAERERQREGREDIWRRQLELGKNAIQRNRLI